MIKLSVFVTLLLLALPLAATEEVLTFENETQRQLYLQLTAELRCPQCQNQNIADSNAIVSVDMRQKSYELIMQGSSRDEVLEYMINRYGNFVHYLPPLNRYTLLLWLAPLLLLLGLIGLQVKRRNAQGAEPLAEEQLASEQPASLDAELDKLIDQYRSKK
ncbi:cytochrome C biogenesis protein [Arsukibacterium sp. MJ3]|uniref:cytochrome c-type biogenesis protein n=1 Tax=Arsukibacterium sp. MJ3 TaxID=1632859 RepID=UPI00062708A7|nr:cytochrome c-type biogenesis protein [Arsukibacterium sp. MJ3]KKO47864.1 cytochrome C biogenesis protein [Arsukibacterium sp. MJ3]